MSPPDAKAARRSERAPALRLIYAVVFLGIASAAYAASYPEVLHLLDALSREFHSGIPPRPVTLLGVAVVTFGVLGVLWAFLRRREIPLAFSLAILLGGAACLVGLSQEMSGGRSWASADKEILRVASLVHRQMVDRLQTEGAVPTDEASWQRVLDEASKGQPSPARTRGFAQVPYSVARVKETEDRPAKLIPGTLVFWVAPEGEAFDLHPIGFDREGGVAQLADDRGEKLVLKGTFNPDAKEQLPGLPALPSGLNGGFGVPGGSLTQ